MPSKPVTWAEPKALDEPQLLAELSSPSAIHRLEAQQELIRRGRNSNVLAKLRRSVRDLRVEYPYAGQTALFENDGRYGTIVYRVGKREHVSRSTTEEIVLDDLETLAGLTPPQRGESTYAGHPLAATPRGATAAFYVIWPLLVVAYWTASRR